MTIQKINGRSWAWLWHNGTAISGVGATHYEAIRQAIANLTIEINKKFITA